MLLFRILDCKQKYFQCRRMCRYYFGENAFEENSFFPQLFKQMIFKNYAILLGL